MKNAHCGSLAVVAAIGLAFAAAGPAVSPALAQTSGTGGTVTGCGDFAIAWNKGRDRGPIGRRDTLKSAMALLDAGDQALPACMVSDFAKHYALESFHSNGSNGHAPLIKEVRNNLNAVKTLPAAQQCRAATMFVEGWTQFHANNPDVPELVHGAMVREQAQMCAAK